MQHRNSILPLQGVRALCCAAIVFSHVWTLGVEMVVSHYSDPLVTNRNKYVHKVMALSAVVAVDVFFMLASFLLTFKILQMKTFSLTALLKVSLYRYIRLFSVVPVVMMIGYHFDFLLPYHLSKPNGLSEWIIGWVTLTPTINSKGLGMFLGGHLWTLCTDFHGNLIVIVLLYGLRKLNGHNYKWNVPILFLFYCLGVALRYQRVLSDHDQHNIAYIANEKLMFPAAILFDVDRQDYAHVYNLAKRTLNTDHSIYLQDAAELDFLVPRFQKYLSYIYMPILSKTYVFFVGAILAHFYFLSLSFESDNVPHPRKKNHVTLTQAATEERENSKKDNQNNYFSLEFHRVVKYILMFFSYLTLASIVLSPPPKELPPAEVLIIVEALLLPILMWPIAFLIFTTIVSSFSPYYYQSLSSALSKSIFHSSAQYSYEIYAFHMPVMCFLIGRLYMGPDFKSVFDCEKAQSVVNWIFEGVTFVLLTNSGSSNSTTITSATSLCLSMPFPYHLTNLMISLYCVLLYTLSYGLALMYHPITRAILRISRRLIFGSSANNRVNFNEKVKVN